MSSTHGTRCNDHALVGQGGVAAHGVSSGFVSLTFALQSAGGSGKTLVKTPGKVSGEVTGELSVKAPDLLLAWLAQRLCVGMGAVVTKSVAPSTTVLPTHSEAIVSVRGKDRLAHVARLNAMA